MGVADTGFGKSEGVYGLMPVKLNFTNFCVSLPILRISSALTTMRPRRISQVSRRFRAKTSKLLTISVYPAIANYALESGVLDATAITSVAVAAAAYESHQLSKEEPGNSMIVRVFMNRAVLIRALGTDVSAFERLRGILESAITKSRAKGGDESLKLEKFLVYAVRWSGGRSDRLLTFMVQLVNFAGLADEAIEVWESASKFYKTKYYVWTEYASFLTWVPTPVSADFITS